MKKVAVIMGSISDMPVVEKAIKTLQDFGVPHEVHVYSAHRTPEEAHTFSATAHNDTENKTVRKTCGEGILYESLHPCRRRRAAAATAALAYAKTTGSDFGETGDRPDC